MLVLFWCIYIMSCLLGLVSAVKIADERFPESTGVLMFAITCWAAFRVVELYTVSAVAKSLGITP